MSKRSLADLDVAGKRVLVRVDFNVPIEPGMGFSEAIAAIAAYDQRLRATLPTVDYLLQQNCRVILCSHLGRPAGAVDESLRLAPVGDRLALLLNHPVQNLSDCVGTQVESAIGSMQPKDIVLLENLRFHLGEEKNEPEFVKDLSNLADCFVMDAFAVAHRAHASTVGVGMHLPAAMGLLVQREVESLGKALESPEPPMAALLGGAKVSDKILILENMLDKLDQLFIGGGMSVTFLRCQGYDTGASAIEEDRLDFAGKLLEQARSQKIQVRLPEDLVVASEFAADPREVRTVPADRVPKGWYIMDIGPDSASAFAKGLAKCKTIIWNGPMGVFEMPRFSLGTRQIATAIGRLKDATTATTIVGGGSTAEAVEELGLVEQMTHVSTGGGASLEFLEGKELPGIAALPDA